MNYFQIKIGFVLFFIFANLHFPVLFAQTKDTQGGTLKDLIDQKSVELQKIQSQKELVQKNLDEIAASKNSIKTQLKSIDATVGQLNLSVKANTITIEKLGLEIEDTKDQIADLEDRIETKQEGIKKLLFALQQKEHENAFTSLLRNESLSESVGELQTIATLNNTLKNTVNDLQSLHDELEDKLNETKTKKNSREQERLTLTVRQKIIQEQKQEKNQLLESTKNKEKVFQEQLSALEQLQTEISAEIEKVESELRKNINPNMLPMPRNGLLLWPVNGGRLSQGYGATKFALKTYKGKFHNGVDIAAPVGTEIFAAHDGTVINVANQDLYCKRAAYGKLVVIKHDNGLTTLYGHMAGQIVTIGQKVLKGQVIGYMGKTGWATGPHLHFTVFASQTLTPARPGFPEGTQSSRVCGPMPVGGDLNPQQYL